MARTIRRATVDDVDDLVPLFDAYRGFYGQTSDPAGARAFLRARLRAGDSVLFLAARDGEWSGGATGFVQLYPSFSSVRMRPIWIVNDLYVDVAYRRQGIARMLMERARHHGEDTGAALLVLETGKENEAAARLYRDLGYQMEEAFDRYELEVDVEGRPT